MTNADDRPIAEAKADLFKALANPARVRILEVLSSGEHAVSEIAAVAGLEASHVSQQLGILRRAGVVRVRRMGSSMHYTLSSPRVGELLVVAKTLLVENLGRQQAVLRGRGRRGRPT
jgi:ArsR family transcriptional regulator